MRSTAAAVMPERREIPGPARDELEREVIGLFVQLANLLRLPKSIGEIYGMLFLSTEPLSMDDLMRRLRISKGATSQGLKLLRAYGAARTVYVQGDRRDHYVAELELRRLAGGFLKEQLVPELEAGAEHMARIRALMAGQPEAVGEELNRRIEKLDHWRSRARNIVPWLLRFIEQ